MPSPYPAVEIAKYFVNKGVNDQKYCTPMKLQKLVYFSHGWNLAFTGEPLINETIYAWKFGPVIEEIYKEFKKYSANDVVDKQDVTIDPVDTENLDIIWSNYGDLSGVQMSALTHKKGTPWDKIYMPGCKGLKIPNELIKDHYKELLQLS